MRFDFYKITSMSDYAYQHAPRTAKNVKVFGLITNYTYLSLRKYGKEIATVYPN